MSLLVVFALSVAACAALTKRIRDFATSQGWADPPDTTRHLHEKPVPRLGGVAVFFTVTGLAGAGLLVQQSLKTPSVFSIPTTFAILGPAALIFLVGLYDDFRTLGPYAKFGVQILAACLLYLNGIGVHQFTFLFGGSNLSGILGLPLTIIWVLLITNAFNLIDGLDGLAAGAALFSTIVLLVASLVGGNHFIAFLAVVLAGAIVGFLRFNFNPATIFLGDSGSLFIGFMLSALALAGSQKASTMVTVAIPVVCFGLPILDVMIAVLRRFLNGRPLFEGDHEHIHHRLLKRGFSQRHAVLILYGACAFFGLLSLALLHGGSTTALVLVILGVGVCVGIPQLRYQEFKEMRRVLARTAGQKQVIANNLHIHHAAESLRACGDAAELRRILVAALQPGEFDGFRLEGHGRSEHSLRLPSSLTMDANGEWRCSWIKPGSLPPNWELRLELEDERGEPCGSFSLFRHQAGKPVMMDINLLCDGFQSALIDALKRLIFSSRTNGDHVKQEQKHDRAKAVSV